MDRRTLLTGGAAAVAFASSSQSAASAVADEGVWPQGGGPNGNWAVRSSDAPLHWSGARGENIAWRTDLPECGQGGITVWRDRLFLTTMKPLRAGVLKKEGPDAVGYCLDSATGKILWSVDLPGSLDAIYAYGFSDGTTPSPCTDGKQVWFFNACGYVGCYDFQGRKVWSRSWKPAADRPFNKQFEPFLMGDHLVTLEPRAEGDARREADPWNYLKGLDKKTGEVVWVSDDALTHYNNPISGRLQGGDPAVLIGRGGHHDVPEKPVGLSLVSLNPARAGKTLWRYHSTGHALYNMHWTRKYAFWIPEIRPEITVLNVETGEPVRALKLGTDVTYRRFDPASKRYEEHVGVDTQKLTPPLTVFPAWFTNTLVGDYLYYLCFTDAARKVGPDHCIGRVHVETGKVEYLELPVSVRRASGSPDEWIWGKAQFTKTINSRGVDVAGDPRSRRDGWFWCFLGTPTVVGIRIYITNMLGVTYVIDGAARELNAKALLAVNDLGDPTDTWSVNSLSAVGDSIYHRSMKEVVRIRAGA